MTDKLKIDRAPAAFALIAEKHNAVVDLIRRIRGVGPITVTHSDSNVLIGVTGTGGSSGSPVEFVGSNGKLGYAVRHSSYVTPTTYPTALGVVTGSVSWVMDGTGFLMTNASGKTCAVQFASISVNMTLREIDVCDGGTVKKMLILASAPY